MLADWVKISSHYSALVTKEQIAIHFLNYISSIEPSEVFYKHKLKILLLD